jgi:mannosylglycoprotein endo-beta-mannosidase
MPNLDRRKFLSTGAVVIGGGLLGAAARPGTAKANPGPQKATPGAQSAVDEQELASGWTFAAASDATLTGAILSSPAKVSGLQPAVVPGTPLTAMIANGLYPDPLYRHIVTDTVPDTLKDTNYWYRTRFEVPRLVDGQRFWLHFEGVNYLGDIWLNGTLVGSMEGAFIRGTFDVTDVVAQAKGTAYLAVLVHMLDFSEGPSLPSYTSGVTRGGRNGGPKTGATLENGPTFFCTAGWDWIPTIPDRDLGIWQPVRWSTTGPIRLTDVFVDPTLSDDLSSADVSLGLTFDSAASTDQSVTVTGDIGGTSFRYPITVPAGSSSVTLTSADIPQLLLKKPHLWWPNGYGTPYLYQLTVQVEKGRQVYDERSVRFGVRSIEYSVPIVNNTGTLIDTLALTVNGQPILAMGGSWGLDEALKRIPRDRIFEQVRLHRDANLNVIRNWNGQSTTQDLYDACDEYGILVWQEFFKSTEGPAPANDPRDIANIQDVIIRFRNHPSLLLYCGGNEGPPPQVLIDALNSLGAEYDPKRLILTSSAGDTGTDAVNGYTSGGPYNWVTPTTHFGINNGTQWPPFHNEVGSYSIPSLEFIEKMIPPDSWETPNDFWADRDVNGNGQNGGGGGYIALTAQRYGVSRNLPDFARKSQLMNYECIKAIYESRVAQMIGVDPGHQWPPKGIMMWMTNPAQPSFVWNMYTHDLEAHSSFYAVQHACRRINVVVNAATYDVSVGNHTSAAVNGTVQVAAYDLKGERFVNTSLPVSAAASNHTLAGNISTQLSASASNTVFIRASVVDSRGHELVSNFCWLEKPGTSNGFSELNSLTPAKISVTADVTHSSGGETELTVQVKNIGPTVALQVHLQVYDTKTGDRILPGRFSDNYFNLVPGESSQAQVQLTSAPHGAGAIGVRVDGWAINQSASHLSGRGVKVSFNERALDTNPPKITFTPGPTGPLDTLFNNIGISDDSNPSAANFSANASYSEEALTAAGAAPGATVTVAGIQYAIPTVAAGSADNLQVTPATSASITPAIPAGATQLSFLGAASRDGSVPLAITYADGSTQATTLSLSSWTLNSGRESPQTSNVIAVTTPYHNTPTGPATMNTYLFATTPIPLSPGKTVTSVIFPGPVSGGPLHIFAIGTDQGPAS